MEWYKQISIIGPVVLTIAGGVIGYFLKYYLDKKAQFTTQNAEVKRRAYQKLVDTTVGFFINSKKSQKEQASAVDQIAEFYKQYVLYGSPKVVRAFGRFMQVFYKREQLGISDAPFSRAELRYSMRALTRVYKAMRKDIGLSNWHLGIDGAILMRALVKDYDSVIRPKFVVWSSYFFVSLRSNRGKSKLNESTEIEAKTSDEMAIDSTYSVEPSVVVKPRVKHGQHKKKKKR